MYLEQIFLGKYPGEESLFAVLMFMNEYIRHYCIKTTSKAPNSRAISKTKQYIKKYVYKVNEIRFSSQMLNN